MAPTLTLPRLVLAMTLSLVLSRLVMMVLLGKTHKLRRSWHKFAAWVNCEDTDVPRLMRKARMERQRRRRYRPATPPPRRQQTPPRRTTPPPQPRMQACHQQTPPRRQQPRQQTVVPLRPRADAEPLPLPSLEISSLASSPFR